MSDKVLIVFPDLDAFCLTVQRELHEITAVRPPEVSSQSCFLTANISAALVSRARSVHLHRLEPALRTGRQAHRRGDDQRRQPLVPRPGDGHAQYPPHPPEELVGRRPDDPHLIDKKTFLDLTVRVTLV